ncbi:hypothetical protein ASPWEDRAFT_166738 [Aspergillus wentii DTO 134E9]|uniref:Small secreted protein n=1 Tax=Aspergillus wentii DTO 134E9 TaxID=1073089 RepID=A0A1L9S0F8_ASPWE|nr:uncharacterized protein ASPWEDRAFT_166738 [Aspergillus wentii DTO 134E9]KAI9931312.1 hypothetical protein MW887_010976 [Aspergillus wentii]OJJ40670.1 hypothetical protein ASPWEDRAFT_166738 [Aspergillus wentii DTO 134E9]
MVSFKSLAAILGLTATAAASIPSTLNVTVIGAQNNQSTLECWSLKPGFIPSTQAGTAGTGAVSLGAVTGNASYSLLPARFDGGRHNAPAVQWVIFLSGLAHITLPHSKDEAWITGGKYGAILALDTAAVSGDGHYTKYPTDQETIALQVQLKDNKVPGHKVLHQGACNVTELDL